jgi:LysR family transcriptional regulator, glycine cleavage system transcriptional activator
LESLTFHQRMRKELDRLPPLDLLLAFEAAARHLSFTRAASERFVTQSAVSRQIRALEDDLGVALFARQHRALLLTPAGEKLLLACQNMLAQMRRTVAGIRAPAAREVLAITGTPSFVSLWLIPRLRAFTQANPAVDVRLDASYDIRDLRGDGFDIAVRYQRASAGESEPLFRESMLPVCAPSLLRGKGAPPLKTAADLHAHTLLQMETLPGTMPLEWDSWLSAHGLPELQPRSMVTFSSYNEVVTAALEGQGVALGRRPLIDGLLRQKKLVTLFGTPKQTAKAYFVVTDPPARARPAVRAMEEWLRAEAAKA